MGELLATPAASQLEAISACLLDCDDATREARLEARGPEWLTRAEATLSAYLNWAAWMRGHAVDPTSRVEVIRCEAAWSEMQGSRWSGWHAGDPRWCVRVIDTSASPVEEVARELIDWISEERALFRSATHPLLGCDLERG